MTSIPGQTRLSSIIETALNTASGMLISILFSIWFIFPAHGIEVSMSTNVLITTEFTVISIIRSYLWRRYFNWRYLKNMRYGKHG